MAAHYAPRAIFCLYITTAILGWPSDPSRHHDGRSKNAEILGRCNIPLHIIGIHRHFARPAAPRAIFCLYITTAILGWPSDLSRHHDGRSKNAEILGRCNIPLHIIGIHRHFAKPAAPRRPYPISNEWGVREKP